MAAIGNTLASRCSGSEVPAEAWSRERFEKDGVDGAVR